jgi:hypothetical protein
MLSLDIMALTMQEECVPRIFTRALAVNVFDRSLLLTLLYSKLILLLVAYLHDPRACLLRLTSRQAFLLRKNVMVSRRRL